MSKREELRRRRQQRARRQQAAIITLISVFAVAVAAVMIYPNVAPIGEITPIEKEVLPFADGKALGPPGAPVVIQEFSDFQ